MTPSPKKVTAKPGEVAAELKKSPPSWEKFGVMLRKVAAEPNTIIIGLFFELLCDASIVISKPKKTNIFSAVGRRRFSQPQRRLFWAFFEKKALGLTVCPSVS